MRKESQNNLTMNGSELKDCSDTTGKFDGVKKEEEMERGRRNKGEVRKIKWEGRENRDNVLVWRNIKL